jgi:hypothetical protein
MAARPPFFERRFFPQSPMASLISTEVLCPRCNYLVATPHHQQSGLGSTGREPCAKRMFMRDDAALAGALELIGRMPTLCRQKLIARLGRRHWALRRRLVVPDEPVGKFIDLKSQVSHHFNASLLTTASLRWLELRFQGLDQGGSRRAPPSMGGGETASRRRRRS